MKKIILPVLAIILAVSSAIAVLTPVEAQSSPPSNPDSAWQPPEEGASEIPPSVGVETYNQNYPSLQLMPVPPVPPGPGGSIVNAFIINSYGQQVSTLRGNETCYLILSVNSPGYFYLWEYYPAGSIPYGHWLAYRWYRPEAGIWRIGPFQAGAWDASGRYTWKMWFQSATYFSSLTRSFNYIRGYSTYPAPAPQPVYPAVINSFTTNMQSLEAGQAATLTWNTSNSDSVSITPGIGSVPVSGSRTVTPSTTTTYTLTATGKTGGPVSSYATIAVAARIRPAFSLSESTIQSGKSSTLIWNAPAATRVSISGVGDFGATGTAKVAPEKTTTYTLTATYLDGSTLTASATIFVENPPFLLWGLIGLLAVAAIIVTALLVRRPRTAAATQAAGTRASAGTVAASTAVASQSPSTTPIEAPPAKLTLPDGSELLLAGNNRSFGRQDFDKFLPVDNRSFISRQHVNIWYEDGSYYVEDRSSTNGTRLNSSEIKGDGRHALADGDVIELAGKFSMTFKT